MFTMSVTLFNKKYDKTTRTDVYKRTVLDGVHFETNHSSSLNDKSMTDTSNAVIIIPFSVEGYISPSEYQELDDVSKQWTLKEGDYIVKGEINEDITDIRNLKNYDNYTIKSIDIIDYSIADLNHFEVTC